MLLLLLPNTMLAGVAFIAKALSGIKSISRFYVVDERIWITIVTRVLNDAKQEKFNFDKMQNIQSEKGDKSFFPGTATLN